MVLASLLVWVVVLPVANMHSAPSADADVVSQAGFATNVQVEEEREGWLRIRTPDDYLGWVEASAVRKVDIPYARRSRVAIIDSIAAHLYRDASVTRFAPLLTVPYETRLEVVAEPEDDERRWLQVRLPDDRAAWVQRGDVAFDHPVLPIAEVIELAKRFVGRPYTWGGATSFGYDCSGYTQMLCRRLGKAIPRDSRPQAAWSGMEPVAKENLRAGDLLFFGEPDQRITHTGMYIGDGQFIHATAYQQPAVQISRLEDQHWTERLLAARRLK
jgi:SH3-like domain-containing protein